MRFNTRPLLTALLLVLFFGATEGKNKCEKQKKKLTAGATASLRSPKFKAKNPKLPCKDKAFEYISPSGTTLKLKCSQFDIKCNKNKSYLWNSVDKRKRCGKSPFSVTSTSNKLILKYFSSNKNKGKKRFFFSCKIEVLKKPEISVCSMCGKRSTVTLSANERSANMTKIVGGQEAQLKEFPYQAFILITEGNGVFQCGGSLVTDEWVVTAAHCNVKTGDSVYLGAHDVTALTSPTELIHVKTAVPHEDYDPLGTDRYDIAVVKLEKKVAFNDYIQPICLPDSFQATDFVGQSLEATGWGTISYAGPTSDILRKVTLSVISNAACEAAGPVYINNIFVDNICTLTPNKDACQGDSGGPLAYHTGGKSFLIGVTSYGDGCAFPNKPGVFTRVSHPQMLRWVKETIGLTCSSTT